MSNKRSEALISNSELDKMVSAIRDKTSRDSAYELLVRVRGTYERERAELIERLAGEWVPMRYDRMPVATEGASMTAENASAQALP